MINYAYETLHILRCLKRACPGVEPGTSCTRSKNHTTRPTGRTFEVYSKNKNKKKPRLRPYHFSNISIYSFWCCLHSRTSCDGRVVKALDLKSNGIFPRRFEPYSQRIVTFSKGCHWWYKYVIIVHLIFYILFSDAWQKYFHMIKINAVKWNVTCDEVKYFIIFFSSCRAAIGQAVSSAGQATEVLDRGELN